MNTLSIDSVEALLYVRNAEISVRALIRFPWRILDIFYERSATLAKRRRH